MNLCPPGCLCVVHPICIVWWKPGCPCMTVCLCPSHLISVSTSCLECVHASVHEFMSTLHPMSAPPPMDSYMESWVPCVSLCLCPIHHGCGPTPCLDCVHASVHEFTSTWLLMSGPPPMHSLMHTWVSLYGSVFVSSHLISVATPCLECVHASVHEFMSTFHPMSCPPLWIVTWKVGCPCVSLHVCPSHLIFVATPCLECVHASVHEFMSTCLLMSGPPPMHSLMETWVPLYVSVFVSQSPHFCCHTLFRMCTCTSTCIYVHLTAHVCPTPMHSLTETWVSLYGSMFVS